MCTQTCLEDLCSKKFSVVARLENPLEEYGGMYTYLWPDTTKIDPGQPPLFHRHLSKAMIVIFLVTIAEDENSLRHGTRVRVKGSCCEMSWHSGARPMNKAWPVVSGLDG